jgi:hypothetical protein
MSESPAVDKDTNVGPEIWEATSFEMLFRFSATSANPGFVEKEYVVVMIKLRKTFY